MKFPSLISILSIKTPQLSSKNRTLNFKLQQVIKIWFVHRFNIKKYNFATLFARFSIKEQSHFAKRMAFLIGAGVPMLESLYILRDQSRYKNHKDMYTTIIDDILSGKFLSSSLIKYEHLFGTFVVNIIKIGETSGSLTKNLNYLADELKKKEELRRKVLSALIYPIFITIVTLLLSGTLTVFIFPKVTPIFQSLNVELPITTVVLLMISNFLSKYGILVILGSILCLIALKFAVRFSISFRFFIHTVSLYVPLSGKLMKYYYMTNFCRTLGLLLKSGVHIVEAITITGETISNLVYTQECEHMAQITLRGERISNYIKQRPFYFPDFTAHLISVGETTGSLSDTLMYLSDIFENEVNDMTKNLSNSVEPILMIFMGLIIGFVAISVITPIYEVTQFLQP